ncbi:MAG: dTDP-4-amino-4,6-dideoxygalactose transaminase [Bdellovibrionales bacterium]|nr:dTDP-4-amino-4,6-dideoxygalactose transaminase [Bdellovibrionales bacterium]
MLKIPFNRARLTGHEAASIQLCLESGHLSGDGRFTKACHEWFHKHLGFGKSLLTHSGTAALEMAALLLNLKPGDEVIMPSFTFVSSANAVVLRGAVPVFVDIRPDTLNIDEKLIEAALTPRTRAIMVVHYGGVSCDMDPIMALAKTHGLTVVEDAAHGILAKYKGRFLGSIGELSALSFHETKNLVSGEGGALGINSSEFYQRAEILREKGTNRSQFFRGEVDKYTWVDVGSSYLPSELIAAFLATQLEGASGLQETRMAIWNQYHEGLKGLEARERLRRPIIPGECEHNAHIYYLLLPSTEQRDQLLQRLKQDGIGTTFHYVPLHSSPAGMKYARVSGRMNFTDDLSARLLRLPLTVNREEANIVLERAKFHLS